MNLQDLARAMSAVAGKKRLPKNVARNLVDLVLESIGDELATTGQAKIAGFGTFTVRRRKARDVRNPKTNELMRIPADQTVGFRPAKRLASRVKGSR